MAKVLVVEDDVLLSNAFHIIIESSGHNVKVVANGQEAISVVQKFNPDVIFPDLLMPVMSGMEFLEKYRSSKQKKLPTTVVLSNMGDQEMIERALKLGAKQYVLKSEMTPTKMIELINSLAK